MLEKLIIIIIFILNTINFKFKYFCNFKDNKLCCLIINFYINT